MNRLKQERRRQVPICIYSRREFGAAPGEHILQNFLGARWTSAEIACSEVQDQFGHTIDVALERGLQAIRNMFGTPGGRGEPGPILRGLEATTGERVDLKPGFQPRLAAPIVQVTPGGDGRHHVRIQLSGLGQLGWALHLLRQQLPNAPVDEHMMRAIATGVEDYIRGTVRLDLSMGGRDYFRGMLKSCFNRLAVERQDVALLPCFDPLRRFILDGVGEMSEFVAWVQVPDRLAVPRIGPIDHFIGIVTREHSVEGVVQFFGDVVHPFRLTENYQGPPIMCGFLVDPTRDAEPAEVRNPEFEDRVIPRFGEQSRENTATVRAAFEQRLTRIVAQFQSMANARLVEKTVEEILGPHAGQPFTEELANRLARRMAERVLRVRRNRP
jgi:hypothetical protein